MDKFDVFIYTDGSSRGNPGPGGYGIVMEWVGKPYRKEFSQGFRKTTNNRMELLAAIEGLRKLKEENLNVKIISDSMYVVDAVEKGWVFKGAKIGLKDKKIPDLWKLFLEQYRKHRVVMQWVKGHNNHPQNERCDVLAVASSKAKDLSVDIGFEQ